MAADKAKPRYHVVEHPGWARNAAPIKDPYHFATDENNLPMREESSAPAASTPPKQKPKGPLHKITHGR